MATTEAVPFNGEPPVTQRVSQPFCSHVRQYFVLHPMALEDREPFAFLEQWNPFLRGEERSGQLDQSGIGLRRSEHHITGQHGALGKSPEDGRTRICAELSFDLF